MSKKWKKEFTKAGIAARLKELEERGELPDEESPDATEMIRDLIKIYGGTQNEHTRKDCILCPRNR